MPLIFLPMVIFSAMADMMFANLRPQRVPINAKQHPSRREP